MDRMIKVLIVDDSSFAREIVKEILSNDPQLKVIGEASNGEEAIEKTASLHPDLITMDITMPVMNGITAIEQIMGSTPTPILVLTSRTDSQIAYEAISKGALEVFRKPKLNEIDALDLIARIKSLSRVKVIKHLIKASNIYIPKPLTPKPRISGEQLMIIGIVSSTGGPKALADILGSLPGDLQATILIAQHIGGGFSQGLATWLNQISPLTVQIADFGKKVLPGHVYIAPNEKHIELGLDNCIRFTDSTKKDLYTPSCNRLLTSISLFATRSIGVVLSGMGNDGSIGIKDLKDSGAFTIAQDEESSVIFGMPGSAIKTGSIDLILPLSSIPGELVRQVGLR